jgi:hypothetical protein
MKRSVLLALAATVLAPAVGAMSIPSASAQLATGPSWQLTYFSLPGGTMTINAVAASGPDNAWAIGNGNAPPSGSIAEGLVQRWNGSAWHPVKVSRTVSEAADGPVGTSSSSDVWAFGQGYAYWNGHKWRTGQLPPAHRRGALINATTVFSANDVWAFGGVAVGARGREERPYAARRTSRGWHLATLPAPVAGADTEIIGASAVSASDIWALAGNLRTSSHSALLHWNGKTWGTVRLPSALTRAGLPASIVGLSATSAWVDDSPRQASTGNVLWHWNGHSWASIASPPDVSIASLSTGFTIASDGHGGIWALGGGGAGGPYETWDYRSGAWNGPTVITTAPNVAVFGLVHTPRSATLWAFGLATVSYTVTDGMIAGYGT